MSSNDEGWNELALSDLSRRMLNLVRPGEVSQVDYAKARIRVKHGDLESNWIPWVAGRAGKNKLWSPPEVGEQVMLLSPGGDMSRAVALPSIFSESNPGNADNGDVFRFTFDGGTVIEYDRANNALKAKLKDGGTANIEASGGVTIKGPVVIDGSLTVTKDTTFEGSMDVNGAVTAQGEVTTLNAGAPINLSTHIHPTPTGPSSSPTPGT